MTTAASPTGKQLVEFTRRAFPDFTPGTRAAHTCGIGVQGVFTPSEVVGRYCTAPMFTSGAVDITARFSNGSGRAEQRDTDGDARGLAVKFFRGAENEADLISMTMPAFFTSTAAAFDPFTAASAPVPVSELEISLWEKIKLAAKLRRPYGSPEAGLKKAIDPGRLVAFATRNQKSKTAVAVMAGLITPTSYGRAVYHGVHTFLITDRDGVVRPIRYRWAPVQGVVGISDEEAETFPKDYLFQELRSRLDRGSVSFALNMVFGDTGDPIADPTTPWPVNRTRISAGTLTITHIADDQIADNEKLSFNPARIGDGFDVVPEDDLMQARSRAYFASCKERDGEGCPF